MDTNYSLILVTQFVIDNQIMNLIEGDEETFQNFKKLPNLYVRIRIDNIQSYKHNLVLFKIRLTKFLNYTKKNKLYECEMIMNG